MAHQEEMQPAEQPPAVEITDLPSGQRRKTAGNALIQLLPGGSLPTRYRRASFIVALICAATALVLLVLHSFPFPGLEGTRHVDQATTLLQIDTQVLGASQQQEIVYLRRQSDGSLTALRAGDGRVIWHFRGQNLAGPPLIAGGYMYLMQGKYVIGMRASDGKLLWRTETPSALSSVDAQGDGQI